MPSLAPKLRATQQNNGAVINWGETTTAAMAKSPVEDSKRGDGFPQYF
ncbi:MULTISPECIES: hypothetical protein [unclassified Synechocystis]|nr:MULTISPECIES: hypothetical protein [unclassified Synechocystis]MBD2617100.1 hypothetical protein [Synechocystis sp. FACHB-898]MBD2638663.1 hypothetical protein [Synechocystis sp. FACHB-908]MBD2659692.1 hypothetical protein [Synechocystis sp. FACHB-929]NHL97606.1 hypothetical protein [Synechocystis sp. PCC 6803]QWO80790.1 hypothetical protein KBZ93_01235 [Synechocystis sp. PCC 6803]